jgi:hypothetical protein
MALVWESRELMEVYKAYAKFLQRKAHRQAIKIALVATVSALAVVTLI